MFADDDSCNIHITQTRADPPSSQDQSHSKHNQFSHQNNLTDRSLPLLKLATELSMLPKLATLELAMLELAMMTRVAMVHSMPGEMMVMVPMRRQQVMSPITCCSPSQH